MEHNLLVNSPCLVIQTAECVFVFPSLSRIDKPTGHFVFFAALSPLQLQCKGDSAAKRQGGAIRCDQKMANHGNQDTANIPGTQDT